MWCRFEPEDVIRRVLLSPRADNYMGTKRRSPQSDPLAEGIDIFICRVSTVSDERKVSRSGRQPSRDGHGHGRRRLGNS